MATLPLSSAARAVVEVAAVIEREWTVEILPAATALDEETMLHGAFLAAIDIARRQSAKMLELRAALGRARLATTRGRPEEAIRHLAGIYGWVTEGFDTADIREAEMLLDAWE